jgi:hypothetical protein
MSDAVEAPEGDGNASETETTPDLAAVAEAQKKVNRDLERKLKAALKERDTLTSELATVREGTAPKDEVQKSLDQARKEAAAEAMKVANARIVRSEIRAAAATTFADPDDAVAFLKLEDFDVDEEGEADRDAIKAALDDLLKQKPHLAAQGSRRWSGNGDGGPREAVAVDASNPRSLITAGLKAGKSR